jgi:hypothetical protein
METQTTGEHLNPQERLERLASSETPLQERKILTAETFSENHKELLRMGADRDQKGRPVTYFRLVGADELRAILVDGGVQSDHNPAVQQRYADNPQWMKRFYEQNFAANTPELVELQADFGHRQAMDFLYTKLSRKELSKFHKNGTLDNVTGLISCSVDAPMQEPTPRDVAIEMVIPASEVVVIPEDGLPLEREIVLTQIKKAWVIDLYFDDEDLTKKVLQNPDYPASAYYGKSQRHDGRRRGAYSTTETLQDWSDAEPIADLLPASKVAELNRDNPINSQPLRVQK